MWARKLAEMDRAAKAAETIGWEVFGKSNGLNFFGNMSVSYMQVYHDIMIFSLPVGRWLAVMV